MKRLVIIATFLLTFVFMGLLPSVVSAEITNGYQVSNPSNMSNDAVTVSTLNEAFNYVNEHANADQWVITALSDDLNIGVIEKYEHVN